MKILALDTSSNACSVALLEGNQQDFSCIERFEMAPRQHTQLILPMIDSVLNEAGYDIKQIDVLAFGRGPGAFTGVRVATGVIQAISYGANIPVAQISSLAAIAQAGAEKSHNLLVANDARMDEVYFAAYEMNDGFMRLVGSEQVIKPEHLTSELDTLIQVDDNWMTIGNGWSVYHESLKLILNKYDSVADNSVVDKSEMSEALSYPNARHIAYLALKEVANETLVSAEQVSPVYLRDNVAKKPKNKA